MLGQPPPLQLYRRGTWGPQGWLLPPMENILDGARRMAEAEGQSLGVAIRPEPAGPVHEVADFRRRPSSNGLLSASQEVELAKRIEAGEEATRRPQSHRPIHSAPPSANPWSIAAGPRVPASYR